MNINDLAKEIHENAIAHGWWDEPRSFGDIIALCHSELSEALEEYRSNKPKIYYHCILNDAASEDKCVDYDGDCCFKSSEAGCVKAKPEGTAVELADCIIRILDYCGHEKIDIEEIIKIKHEFNKTRPYKHGGKIL